MRRRTAHGGRSLRLALLSASALGWGACEPLDLALFPVTADAGEPAVIDVPAQPPADAGGDAGTPPPPPPPPARAPCLEGATACEECVSAEACLGGDVCHPRTGQCVPPCASSAAQCPAGLVCGSLDVCVECVNSDQCERVDDDEPHCDVERGVCVECLTSQDCTDDPLERPACLPLGICGCASDADCSGGAICELDERHCEIEDD